MFFKISSANFPITGNNFSFPFTALISPRTASIIIARLNNGIIVQPINGTSPRAKLPANDTIIRNNACLT